MKEGWKITGCAVLIGLLGADIGLQAAIWFGAPTHYSAIANQKTMKPERNEPPQGRPNYDYAPLVMGVLTLTVLVYQAFILRGQRHIMDRQAGIADGQRKIMQAQVDLEHPRIFCVVRGQNFVEVVGDPAPIRNIPGTITLQGSPKVVFSLGNYGRSPAVLRYINVKIDRKQTAPNEDTSCALVDLPREHVLGGNEFTPDITAAMQIFKAARFPESEYNMLIRGQTYWWLFGSVRFDDVWGGRNIYHFCWRYDQGNRVFDPYPPERNYTERKPPEPHDKTTAS